MPLTIVLPGGLVRVPSSGGGGDFASPPALGNVAENEVNSSRFFNHGTASYNFGPGGVKTTPIILAQGPTDAAFYCTNTIDAGFSVNCGSGETLFTSEDGASLNIAANGGSAIIIAADASRVNFPITAVVAPHLLVGLPDPTDVNNIGGLLLVVDSTPANSLVFCNGTNWINVVTGSPVV